MNFCNVSRVMLCFFTILMRHVLWSGRKFCAYLIVKIACRLLNSSVAFFWYKFLQTKCHAARSHSRADCCMFYRVLNYMFWASVWVWTNHPPLFTNRLVFCSERCALFLVRHFWKQHEGTSEMDTALNIKWVRRCLLRPGLDPLWNTFLSKTRFKILLCELCFFFPVEKWNEWTWM